MRMLDRPRVRETYSAGRVLPLRVLLIDDDPLVLESFAELLRMYGHTVYAYRCGRAALRETRPYDLAITDYQLADATGVELAERLTCEHPGLPVVLMTGWGTATPIYPATIAGLLRKPADIQEIHQVLVRAYSNRPH
jgi:DNA-binding NtrC family response regulator